VVLGALGQREREAGDRELTESEKPIVRRQAFSVALRSALVAVVLTALLYFI
jgi:hypothetical protein